MQESIETNCKAKRNSWIRTLFPGCLFIAFAWVGFFSYAWMLFFVVWIFYLVWLLLVLPKFVSNVMNRPTHYPKRKVLRPLIPVIIIPGALIISRLSCHSAYAFAVDVAQDIQLRIAQDGACPKYLEGWEHSSFGNKSTIYYGKFGAKYKVVYRTPSDLQTFTILVPHAVEYSFVVKGGIDKEFKSTFSGVLERPLDYYKKLRLF